ncbi:MAG: 2-hydroxyacid dehydrogenase [Gammaproteobacteria bacterium]
MTLTQNPTVALVGDNAMRFGANRLPSRLATDWKLVLCPDPGDSVRLRDALADATVLVSGDFGKQPLRAPRLKLLQIPFAGYDWLKRDLLPDGCVVCNTFEHEIPIAEYVMLNILEWEIGTQAIMADFRAGSWYYSMPPDGPYHGEAYGKTVGLIGYGHIGREIARRAGAFGMRLCAVAGSEHPKPEPLAWLGTAARDLDRLLAESDYVVITCPLNDATRGLIGVAQLARMKPSAVLVNVARARIVDEEALYLALQNRVIGGAVLDVWYRYPSAQDPAPRPSRFPFHELANVRMTPHCSAWTHALNDRRWAAVAANLDRYARGEALANVICFA